MLLKIEKRGLTVNLFSGEIEGETGDFEVLRSREKDLCPYKEFEKILKNVKKDFVYDVANIMKKEGIDVFTVSLNSGFLRWVSHTNESLRTIENTHQYSQKYIEDMTRLTMFNEYFRKLLEERISLKIQKGIKALEDQEGYTEEFLQIVNLIFRGINENSDYKGKTFNI